MARPARRTYVVAAAAGALVVVVGAVAVGVARGSADTATRSADPPYETSATPSVTLAPSDSPTATPTASPTRTAKVSPRPSTARTTSSPRASALKTTASPRPSPTPTTAAFRFPVPVAVGSARQVVTVEARGSYATVLAWQWRSGAWHQVLATTAARVGTHGVVPGSTRKQGTGTTPGGTYTMTSAFGISSDPGARLPYHRVTSDDWWVEDNLSAYYNQMRRASQGGFRTNLPPSDMNSSEHLLDYTVQYRYAVIIDFNRWPAVRYRGAGIFLHVNGPGSTAGCVSVPQSMMVRILRWLDPAQHPRIAIA